MLDTDNNTNSYDIFTATNNRNPFVPLAGFRKSLKTFVDTKACKLTGTDEDGIDRFLSGYDTCSF